MLCLELTSADTSENAGVHSKNFIQVLALI